MKISFKITVVIIAIIVLSITSTGLLVYLMSSRIFTQETQKTTQAIVESQTNTIIEIVERQQKHLKGLTMSQNVLKVLSSTATESDVNQTNEELKEYFDKNTMESVFLADKNGIVVANADPNFLNFDLSKRDYVINTLAAQQPQISDTLISATTGKPIVTFTLPIIDNEKKETIGLVVAVVSARSLVKYVDNIKLGGETANYVYIIDKLGNLIYSRNEEEIGKQVEVPEIVNITNNINSVKNMDNLRFNLEENNLFGAYAVVPGVNWVLVVADNQNRILEPVIVLSRFIFFIGFISIVLASFLGYLLIRRISGPIKTITDKLNQLSTGDLDVEIPKEYIKSKDEIGQLSIAMTSIIENLEEKALVAEKMADGNLNIDVNIRSDKDSLSKNMCRVVNTLTDVNSEIKNLIESSNEGRLQDRANENKFEGDWRAIVGGLNNLLDVLISPIHETTFVLGEMAKGNLNVNVKGQYKGDFVKIKNSLNESISSIHSYTNEISNILTEMSNGNLVVEINRDYKGDFSKIKKSLNDIINSFNTVLLDINNSSEQVAISSKHIAQSSIALSQGATEQASAIEQLTASIEEISAKTKMNAKNSMEVNSISDVTRDSAVNGNIQMQELLNAVEEINYSSKNISKVIKVIDEIAFQTNILALNAAVEAARAGQQGKGFAVVADEVRNLAARSASAAKETTEMIENSIKKADSGKEIAYQTADALSNIVEGVNKVSHLVNEITVISKEQESGILQINQGITQVSQVIQTNSATSEENSAASQQLASMSIVLKDKISKFTLKTHKIQKDPEDYEFIEELMQIKK